MYHHYFYSKLTWIAFYYHIWLTYASKAVLVELNWMGTSSNGRSKIIFQQPGQLSAWQQQKTRHSMPNLTPLWELRRNFTWWASNLCREDACVEHPNFDKLGFWCGAAGYFPNLTKRQECLCLSARLQRLLRDVSRVQRCASLLYETDLSLMEFKESMLLSSWQL